MRFTLPKKSLKKVLTGVNIVCIISLALEVQRMNEKVLPKKIGVWLSLARALDLGSRGRRFESCHPGLLMRVQFNGRTPAFQAGYVGSIPITRLFLSLATWIKNKCLQLSRIEHWPSKPGVMGSNPLRHVCFKILIWWVQLSRLERQVVALEAVGSNPITHPKPYNDLFKASSKIAI